MADYRRKKRNLNKVDFTNKTKNQSKRYLINQFESLGIKVPNYVNNPTTGNINKALRRINNELDKIAGEKDKIDFGSQIRNYVLHPYKMVKDVRTNYEVGNAEGVLDGDLNGFMNAFLSK